MQKNAVILTCIVVVLAVSFPNVAGAWSTQGGEVVPKGNPIGTLGVGFPGLRAMFHVPAGKNFEVAPSFWFVYAHGTRVAILGDTVSMHLKYMVFEKGPFKLALAADIGVYGYYYPRYSVAVQMGFPQLLMSLEIIDKLSLHFGLKSPIAFYVYPNFFTKIPILVNIGAEFSISPRMSVFGSLDMGVDIGGGFRRVRIHKIPSKVSGRMCLQVLNPT